MPTRGQRCSFRKDCGSFQHDLRPTAHTSAERSALAGDGGLQGHGQGRLCACPPRSSSEPDLAFNPALSAAGAETGPGQLNRPHSAREARSPPAPRELWFQRRGHLSRPGRLVSTRGWTGELSTVGEERPGLRAQRRSDSSERRSGRPTRPCPAVRAARPPLCHQGAASHRRGERPPHPYVPPAQDRGHSGEGGHRSGELRPSCTGQRMFGGGSDTPSIALGSSGDSPHRSHALVSAQSTAVLLIRSFTTSVGSGLCLLCSVPVAQCVGQGHVWGPRQLWAGPRPPGGAGGAVWAPYRPMNRVHTDRRLSVTCRRSLYSG